MAKTSRKSRAHASRADETVLELVKRVLADGPWVEFEANDVTANADLVDDLRFDSLDFCEMAIALEEEFGLEDEAITAEAIEGVKNVGDVVSLIQELLPQRTQAENLLPQRTRRNTEGEPAAAENHSPQRTQSHCMEQAQRNTEIEPEPEKAQAAKA